MPFSLSCSRETDVFTRNDRVAGGSYGWRWLRVGLILPPQVDEWLGFRFA